jgi:hypothetical protein
MTYTSIFRDNPNPRESAPIGYPTIQDALDYVNRQAEYFDYPYQAVIKDLSATVWRELDSVQAWAQYYTDEEMED